jgi:hypothetical protein
MELQTNNSHIQYKLCGFPTSLHNLKNWHLTNILDDFMLADHMLSYLLGSIIPLEENKCCQNDQ